MTQKQIIELKEIYQNLIGLRDEAYQLYCEVIDAFAHGGRPTKEQLDEIIDGLLEYCDEERFILLYKRLCRLIYKFAPEYFGEHASWLCFSLDEEDE
ncbi:MAG: hypothetical protein IJ766_00120 [Clostridia bacterium]|nr:hypothetical protein [Clostridia bacterium]